LPWFRVPQRRSRAQRIVFGHWSTLGPLAEDGVIALDSGCLWGRRLTAWRLDAPGGFVSVPCDPALAPAGD
jgi:bis(5'-nucleosyl)-tetraphosphatase (symmetrical)